MRQRWTPEEVAIIKNGFLAGKLVKIIASEVGRSQTAVNKFLSRSGIRTRRWSIQKPRPSVKSSSETEGKRRNLEADVSRNFTGTVHTGEIATGFQEVLRYLEENGYVISMNTKKAFAPLDDYAVDGKPVSDVKLLLIANRLRRENHQPVFAVPELAWT